MTMLHFRTRMSRRFMDGHGVIFTQLKKDLQSVIYCGTRSTAQFAGRGLQLSLNAQEV